MKVAPPKDVNSKVPALTNSEAPSWPSLFNTKTFRYITMGHHLPFFLEELNNLIFQFFSTSSLICSPLYHLKVGVERIGVGCQGEIIDELNTEGDAGQIEEALPANPFDPFAHALMLARMACPGFDNIAHRIGHFRPVGGLLGRNGITRRENFGGVRALEILPPTQMDIPSPTGSASGIPGHIV